MAVEAVIAPEAALDLREAHGWYEIQRAGLGEEFLSCVEACVQGILRRPLLNALVHENYRRALVRRFPYAVFYEATEQTVTIYGVFHLSRDPEKWKERLS